MATTATRSAQQRRTAAGTTERTSEATARRYHASGLLTEERQEGTRTRTQPAQPRRTTRTNRPTRSNRVGSRRQPVSVRGRRVVEHKYPSKTGRLLAIAVIAAAIGIGVVMWVSGLTTAQTFEITEAQKQSTTLSNEIESLERDAEHAKSGANLAKEATELGMVAPDQSGVLDARGAEVVEARQPGVGEDRAVTDVNSEARPRGATSNPDQTDNVAGLAPEEAVVAGVGADVTNPQSNGNNSNNNSNNNNSSSNNSGDLPYSQNQQQPAAPAPAAPPA